MAKRKKTNLKRSKREEEDLDEAIKQYVVKKLRSKDVKKR